MQAAQMHQLTAAADISLKTQQTSDACPHSSCWCCLLGLTFDLLAGHIRGDVRDARTSSLSGSQCTWQPHSELLIRCLRDSPVGHHHKRPQQHSGPGRSLQQKRYVLL